MLTIIYFIALWIILIYFQTVHQKRVSLTYLDKTAEVFEHLPLQNFSPNFKLPEWKV